MLQTLRSAVRTRECMHTLHAQGQFQPKLPSWLQGMRVETNVLPAPVPPPLGRTAGGQRPPLGAEAELLAAPASCSGGSPQLEVAPTLCEGAEVRSLGWLTVAP